MNQNGVCTTSGRSEACPGAIPRPRLSNGPFAPITLVEAFAGSGKTWLVKSSQAYFSCRTSHSPSKRQRVLAAELARAFPGSCSLTASLEEMLTQVADFGKPVRLALDDLHRTPDLGWLQHLVEARPSNLHLTLLSRAELALPLERLRVEGKVRSLDSRELAFNPQEAAQFLQPLRLADADVEALWSRTCGWPAVLELCRQELSQVGACPQRYLEGILRPRGAVRKYLEQEVLAGLSPELETALTVTSQFDVITLETAAFLTSPAELELLLNSKLLLSGPGQDYYQYHPLVRQLLRDRGNHQEGLRSNRRYWSERGLDWLRRGYREYVEQGVSQLDLWDSEVRSQLGPLLGELYQMKGDWEKARSFYQSAGPEGLPRLLQAYVKDRPGRVLEQNWEEIYCSPSERIQLNAWRGAAHLLVGNDWATGYSVIEKSYQDALSIDCAQARFAAQLAYAFGLCFPQGRLAEALALLQEGEFQFQWRKYPLLADRFRVNRAVILLITGQARAALELLTRSDSFHADAFVSQARRVVIWLAHLESEEDGGAVAQLLLDEQPHLNAQIRPYALSGLIRWLLRQGQLTEVQQLVGQLQVSMGSGFYALEGNLTLARYYRAAGDLKRWRATLEKNQVLCLQAGADWWSKQTIRELESGKANFQIQTLGGLRVSRKDVLLELNLTGTERDLFCLILAAGERGLKTELLQEEIWPGSNAGKSKKSLSVHLANLRKKLGDAEVIESRNGHYRVNQARAEVDSVKLESACRSARVCWKAQDLEGLKKAQDLAARLYQGNFLPDEQGLETVRRRRETLQHEYRWLRKKVIQ
jgi:hypothetical protein